MGSLRAAAFNSTRSVATKFDVNAVQTVTKDYALVASLYAITGPRRTQPGRMLVDFTIFHQTTHIDISLDIYTRISNRRERGNRVDVSSIEPARPCTRAERAGWKGACAGCKALAAG